MYLAKKFLQLHLVRDGEDLLDQGQEALGVGVRIAHIALTHQVREDTDPQDDHGPGPQKVPQEHKVHGPVDGERALLGIEAAHVEEIDEILQTALGPQIQPRVDDSEEIIIASHIFRIYLKFLHTKLRLYENFFIHNSNFLFCT